MRRELILEVPTRLATTGDGTLSFTVTILNNEYSGWQRTCRIEGVAESTGAVAQSRFHPSGAAALMIPGEISGTLLATLEIAESEGGPRLSGAFELTIDRLSSVNVRIDAASHEVKERTVFYQPIDLGDVATQTLEVVGDKTRLPLCLVEELPGCSIPLEDLLELEQYVPLPDRDDGIARVLSIHLGPTTVVGRCFASQLDRAAAALMHRYEQRSVHWVTLWDDCRVNKISALLRFRPVADKQSLVVTNVTDYSRARRDLLLLGSAGDRTVAAGETVEIPLEAEDTLTIAVGDGTSRRVLVRCRYEEAVVGRLKLPVLRTERTTFRFPPQGSELSLVVHYLGIWLPVQLETLETALEVVEEPLKVSFPRDMVYFWIRYRHTHGLLTVSSSEDLCRSLQTR